MLLLFGVSAIGTPRAQPGPPRGRLVYKHLAKTGGQAIISALKSQYAPLITDGTLIVKTEQQPVTPEDAREAYIISSVRNPCALYVSLWAWGVAGHGRYNRLFKERHASDPAMARVFDDVSNSSAFGTFARASLGEFSRRYRDYVPAIGAVDCWVHTESVDADFERCIAAFAAQAPRDVAARMRAASWRGGGGGGAIRNRTARDGARTAVDNGMRSLSEKANANSIAVYNVHQSHHQPCEFYFRANPDLVGLILQADAHVFDSFPEYEHGCCADHRGVGAVDGRGGAASDGGAPSGGRRLAAAGSRASRLPTAQAAAAALRRSGWAVPQQDGGAILSAGGRGGGRRNCEFSDLGSERLAPRAAAYSATLRRDGPWEGLVSEYAADLGLFGLISLAFDATVVPHTAMHVMGLGAATHAASAECRAAGGVPSDMSAGLAVASLSPLWGGLQHGLLAGGLMQLNATIGAPGYGRLVWKWALSRLACDLHSAEAGSRGAAGGMDGLAEGASLRDYSSCVHGLGHGLLMQAMGGHVHGFGDEAAAGARDREGHEHGAPPAAPDAAAALEVALAACGAAPRPAEGCQCASGAFMQAQMEGVRGGQSSLLARCRAAAPGLSVGCWLRYWMEHAGASPGKRPPWEAALGVGAIGVDDACTLMQDAPASAHAACVFGWSKAVMLNWYRSTFKLFLEEPSMLLPPSLPAAEPRAAKGDAAKAPHPRAWPNASAFLYFCSVYAPPEQTTASEAVPSAGLSGSNEGTGGIGSGGVTWPSERAWRACLFGAVSDLARERDAGIALLSHQSVDDQATGSKGQWRVLRAACEGYFPASDFGQEASGGLRRADGLSSAAMLASVRSLCLEALLSHAAFDHYSPCGHQVLLD